MKCDELKSFIVLYDGKFIRAYKESEADKVIAEKDKEIAKLKEQVALLQAEFIPEPVVQMIELKAIRSGEIYDIIEYEDCYRTDDLYYQKSEADKVIARHKYKRCLAMARIALDDWHLHNSFYAMGHQEFEKRKCEFYEKWRNRWLAIAEKFKEAK